MDKTKKVSKDDVSGMMHHYLTIKENFEDCVLFYRLGDFYEMFFEDAVRVSKLLDLTLTGKDCGLPERAPMCGIPYHAADDYIAKPFGMTELTSRVRAVLRRYEKTNKIKALTLTRVPSAEPPVPIRQPTPACSTTSVISLPLPMTRKSVATVPVGSPSM